MASKITVVALETEGYNSNGTTFTETVYLSSHPYNPPAGPPPEGGGDIDPYFNPRILTDPLVSFAMGCEAFKSSPVQTIGDLEIDNSNNEMKYLLTRKSKGLEARYYMGDDDADFDTFELIASLIQDEFIQSAEDRIKLPFVDALGVLNDPMPMDKYPSTIPNVSLWETPVPEIWGKIKSVKLEPYDKANEIYVVSADASLGAVDNVRDAGIVIPLGTPPTPSTYQLINVAEGYIAVQFVSNTVGPLTIECRSTEAPGVDILFDRVADKYGLTVNSASMVRFDALINRDMGVSITDPITGAEVLENILKPLNGWYWLSREGEIKVDQLREAEGSPKILVDRNNGFGGFFKISDKGTGVTASLNYQKNWFVHEEDQVAAGVPTAHRDYLIKDYRYAVSNTDSEVFLDPYYSEAEDREAVGTTINNTNQSKVTLVSNIALYGSRRWFYKVGGVIVDPSVIASLEPNDVIALNEEDFGLIDPYDIDIHGRPLAYNNWCLGGGYKRVYMTSSGDNGVVANVLENKSTLQCVGNNWIAHLYPYTITEDTVLEFDFYASTDTKSTPQILEGEILAIGVCTSTSLTWTQEQDRYFQIAGTQTAGVQDYNNYVMDSGWKRYRIPIGQYITGYHDYIRIVADYDLYSAGVREQDTRFRNVRLREDGYLNTLLVAADFNLGDREVSLVTWGA